jgi:CHAT domain-containing protein
MGRTLSVSILPLMQLGEYDRALAAGRRAQEIFTLCGDKLRLARLQINVGNIYVRRDRFSDALACYERAYAQLLPLKDTEGIASSLHNMAVCLISLNDFRRALVTYERARAYCEAHNMPLAVVQADYNIAYLHYMRGAYSRAIDMLGATRNKAEAVGDAYHTALCRLDLADIYLELNLIEEAASTAEEAFRSFQRLEMRYEAAKALTNLATAIGRQGKTWRALELLVHAKAMFEQEANNVWPWLIDLYRAALLFNERQYDGSRDLCLKALEFFETSRLPNRLILCRLMLAQSQLSAGQSESAERGCRRALSELTNVEAPLLAHRGHLLMGQIQEAHQDHPAAYQSYRAAREVLEGLWSHLHHEELKIAFVQDRLEVYERLVNICLERRSDLAVEEAFQYIEEAKSRSLRDLIARHGQLPTDELEQSESLRRIRDLREGLNWYYHRIEREQLNRDQPSLERREHLQAMALAREKELLKLLRETPNSDARINELYRPAAISLADVRAILPPDATLVEFFRVGCRFWAIVVTPKRCETVPVAEVSRVTALVALLQFQLSKFRASADYVRLLRPSLRATQSHLRELYQGLLAPLRPLLRTPHLIFVPHGTLHYLPFHALFDGRRHLTDSYTISYAPSASVLALCHRRSVKASGPSLILGVPDPRAPNILEEVQTISTILPDSELFVGESASEEKLVQKGPHCSFIHIATHAYFRQDNPLFSGIRLGTSYLTLLDLYRLKLPAQLITLSGCGTGMNVVAGGDELLGLVRGFLSAGSQSLLLTLWDVHDATTTRFMKSFYGRLRHGDDKALALQSAMVELREEYLHPYYWAPFVLVGRSLS